MEIKKNIVRNIARINLLNNSKKFNIDHIYNNQTDLYNITKLLRIESKSKGLTSASESYEFLLNEDNQLGILKVTILSNNFNEFKVIINSLIEILKIMPILHEIDKICI
jgi:hypothetical protein